MTTVSIVRPSRSLKRYLTVSPASAERRRWGVTLLWMNEVCSAVRAGGERVRIASKEDTLWRQNQSLACAAR